MKSELTNSLKQLQEGRLILYPTDTVWGIGCDATKFEAVSAIYKLKKRQESKSMICLMSDIKMLQYYIKAVPKAVFDIIENVKKPTTIIYQNPKNVAKNLIGKDNTLAIRIVKEGFCHELIKQLKHPLVSTSANISGHSTPKTFEEIQHDILKGVDYVVNLHRDKKSANPSSIFKIENDGIIKIIRD